MYDEENTFEQSEHIYFPPKRIHPADTLFSFIKTIKDTIVGLGIGALALIRQSPNLALLFIGAFLLILLITSFFSWLRHTYRVEDGELRVEKGIFIRKKSYISINRIHKIDFTANVLHRILKLVQVNVDTAAGGSGVTLTALKLQDAEQLRDALKQVQTDAEIEDVDEEKEQNPVKTISWKHLIVAGMTSGSAGFLMLGALVLFSQIQQFIPDSAYKQAVDFVIQFSIVFLVVVFFVGLILLWLIGTLGTVIKFGNFSIEKRPEELFVKRGLLETKELTIPYDRIQSIEIEQSILRKPLKLCRVIAVTAGSGSSVREANPVIFPLLPYKDVEPFLKKFVPEYANINHTLTPLNKKGLKYYMLIHSIFFIVAFIPVVYFFPTFSWIPALFIVIGLLFGRMKFKETGFLIDDKRIITSYWSKLTKCQTIIFKKRVQVYEKHQHKLQQIEQLATADFAMIGLGAQVTLKHLADEDANIIADWYSRRN